MARWTRRHYAADRNGMIEREEETFFVILDENLEPAKTLRVVVLDHPFDALAPTQGKAILG